MNPVVYNENGQFRFLDFVGYMPEFLRSEPDVVTLMQLMSDYLNNAYRNLETTTQFEFMLCCVETDLNKTVAKLEKLREMFYTASSRSDAVLYLSSPRNNVKTNYVLGNAGAQYPVEIEYDGAIADTIDSATKRGIGTRCTDGQVVYVKYRNANPVQVIPYYYDKSSNMLIREPMGGSQDPFSNTPNKPSRMLSFNVSDVSTVSKRYGEMVEKVSYYEVFFTITISNITDVAGCDTVNYDVDGINGEGDDLLIDYYNATSTASNKYHAVMKFADSDGFNWNGSFPTGMFYFKSSSGANLVRLGNDTTVLSADPALSPSVERYGITGLTTQAGTLTVYLDVFPGIYSNAFFYIVHVSSGMKLGIYRSTASANIERYDTGKKYITLSSVDGSDGSNLLKYAPNELCLIIVPLFYDKKILDYSNAYKMVRWDYQVSMCDGQTVDSDKMIMYGVKTYENTKLTTFSPTKADKNVTGNTMYLDVPSTAGKRLFCNNTMWQGIATVQYAPQTVADMEKGLYVVEIDSRINRSSLGGTYDIYEVTSGFAEATENGISGYWEGVSYNAGDMILFEPMTDVSEPSVIMKVKSSTDTTMTFDCTTLVPGNWYKMTKVEKDSSVCIDGFVYRNSYVDYTAGAVKWSVGDVFVQQMMFAIDPETQVTSLVHMITDVLPVKVGSYIAGQYVSDGKNVYYVNKDVSISSTDSLNALNGLTLDSFDHYSIGLKKVTNAFIPYYGSVTTLDFGERPAYSSGNANEFTAPLYIKKMNDIRLRYGWQQREYMYYGSEMKLGDKSRNGFIEIYGDGTYRDIVESDLANFADGYVDYPIVKSGKESRLVADVDSTVIAVNNHDGTFTATVKSSDHGLVDGAEISMYGLTYNNLTIDDFFLNARYVKVKIIDPDTFTYVVDDVDGKYSNMDIVYGGHKPSADTNAYAVYYRDYKYDIKGVTIGADGLIRIECANIDGHCDVGTDIRIDNCKLVSTNMATHNEFDLSGNYTVIADPVSGMDIDQYICIDGSWIDPEMQGAYAPSDSKARVYVEINDGDLVFDGTHVYKVSSGIWSELSRTDLSTPFVIFARQNYFDVDQTNSDVARGNERVINSLRYIGDNKALVIMGEPISYITPANASYIENKTMVYIRNVYPTYYCGWHTITKVHSTGMFEIELKDVGEEFVDGRPVVNRQMCLYDSQWYKYTVHNVEWDKISNCATYIGRNTIADVRLGDADLGDDPDNLYITTAAEHNMSVGDRVVFDLQGSGCYKLNSETIDVYKSLFRSSVVRAVKGGKCFVVSNTSNEGDLLVTDSMQTTLIVKGETTVFKGLVLGYDGTTYDHIDLFRGEYNKTLHVLGDRTYRFTADDIIVCLGQINPTEIGAWRVLGDDKQWMPIRKKRVMKIDGISVEMMRNPKYNEYEDVGGENEYAYVLYNDALVGQYTTDNHMYYMVQNPLSRNYEFTKPHVDELDTTRHILSQFSSKYDYASVAPRDDLEDKSFTGIPDMKYPLIEKIERLAYLKDANVLDIDLIGYLARYMGYDITAIVDDINASNVYRTPNEREKALRETIENLPQYYSLGGIKPGLNMLMTTFGIVADVLTMWTNTSRPYEELLTEREVSARVSDEIKRGNVVGTWVPTPHISMRIPINSNFKNLLLGADDIATIREQIRVFKPINVVFDGITMVFDADVNLQATISAYGGTAYSKSAPVIAYSDYDAATGEATEYDDINYDVCNTINCVF